MATSPTDHTYTLGGDSTLLYSKMLGAGGYSQVHEVHPLRVLAKDSSMKSPPDRLTASVLNCGANESRDLRGSYSIALQYPPPSLKMRHAQYGKFVDKATTAILL
jgi:hypothetical protein